MTMLVYGGAALCVIWVAMSARRAALAARSGAPDAPPCPKCGEGCVVPIVYGYPSEDTKERERLGLVWLAGCSLPTPDEMHHWYCKRCRTKW